MKIIYRQPQKSKNCGLSAFGITNCYLKYLSCEQDGETVIKKVHRHTDFELHTVIQGCQEYLIGKKQFRLQKGDFLLIFPDTEHLAQGCTDDMQKYALTFKSRNPFEGIYVSGRLSERMEKNLAFADLEAGQRKEMSPLLVENSIAETIISVLRLAGMPERTEDIPEQENGILPMAKQFIKDNINRAVTVAETAEYCHLSAKQLTRIFLKFQGCTPKEYIIKQRTLKIESLLCDRSLTLKQICEETGFEGEYYFNAFFKRNYGMPPGEYRKMLGQ